MLKFGAFMQTEYHVHTTHSAIGNLHNNVTNPSQKTHTIHVGQNSGPTKCLVYTIG